MATLLDGQVGFKKQTTFGTPVTVDRFVEVLADSTHSFDPQVIQGMGLRVDSRYPRSARRLAGTGSGEVVLKVELNAAGLGTLWELLSGTSASTLVSTGLYQQVHTPVVSVPFMPSATIQIGVPELDGSGTVVAYTYSDCVAKSFGIEAPDGDAVPVATVTFWAGALTTATALATASYTAGSLLTAADGGCTLGGSLTVATTTSLASGGTAASNIRSWSFDCDLGLGERPKIGGWQRPAVGKPSATLKIKQDFDATTAGDALIAQTSTSFTGWASDGGTSRWQLDVPSMMPDSDALGQLTDGAGSVPETSYTVLDNLSDPAWEIVVRTADSAL